MVSEARKKLGDIMKTTHDLWDLEAFGREVKRRKILERLYRKLYRYRDDTRISMAMEPKEVLDFLYGRAADGYPYQWRDY